MADFEATTPRRSRWDQEDSEYVRTNDEWIHRSATQVTLRWPEVTLQQASSLGQELSLNEDVRALSPGKAASDIVWPT